MTRKPFPPKNPNHLHNLASWQSRTWKQRHADFYKRLEKAKQKRQPKDDQATL